MLPQTSDTQPAATAVPLWYGGAAHAVDVNPSGGLKGPVSEIMKQAITKALYAYWNDVRGSRLAPKRFEIEPSQIAGILPDTFILERVDASTARFRLAGTRICEAFGAEFRGVNFFDLFGNEDRLTLLRQFSVIARQGAGCEFVLSAESETGKTAQFEVLLLPLMHTRETIDRFLGSIAPVDRQPWFGSEPLSKSRIVSLELVWPDGRSHAMIDQVKRQTPFMPHMREARIVRSDRRQFRVYDGGLSTPEDK